MRFHPIEHGQTIVEYLVVFVAITGALGLLALAVDFGCESAHLANRMIDAVP